MSGDLSRGHFVWHELQTTDPGAAKAFYTALIGWGTHEYEGLGQPYSFLMQGEMPLGGVMQLPPEAAAAGAPPNWMSYVTTPDVDATTARASKLGATVLVPPSDIPEMGRFSVLQDPQGAVLATWKAAGEIGGHGGPPNLGEFSWHELYSSDWEKAFAFYSDLFGWKKLTPMDMGPAGIYQLFGRTDLPLGGMFTKPAEMPGPCCWMYYVLVPDVHQGAEKVKKLGGQVLNGPLEVPGGDWIVQCTDPQGAAFALHHRAAPAA
jgi:predicted enzyme related to lactoylglutathione lyase